jgi:DNA replication protein DnaC
MKPIQEILKSFPTDRTYTQEQIELSRAAVERKLAEQMGMCRYDCEICHGLGWVRDGNGGAIMCPNVNRWKLPSAVRYGITEKEAEELNWNSIVMNKEIQRATEAIKQCLSWGFGWVFLHGSYGTGKTYLLKIAVAEYLRQNKTSAYTRMAEIIDHLRQAFDPKIEESDSERLDWWSYIPLLAIDEFDRVRETEYGIERRFILMDRRYEEACRQKSITLMASNEPPDELPGYLRDRINDGRFSVIKIDGGSMRPGLGWK